MNNNLTNYALKKIYGLVALLLCNIVAIAQTAEVNGVVTSASGNALGGASVLVQGTNRGTITNNNSQYKINASPDDSLIFRYVGFVEQHIAMYNHTFINVTLQSTSSPISSFWFILNKYPYIGSSGVFKNLALFS